MKKILLIVMCVGFLISCGYQDVNGILVTKAYHRCKDKGGVQEMSVPYNGAGSHGVANCMDGTEVSLFN